VAAANILEKNVCSERVVTTILNDPTGSKAVQVENNCPKRHQIWRSSPRMLFQLKTSIKYC